MTMKYTAEDVWGFASVHAAMPPHPTDANHDYVRQFMTALNAATEDRGIPFDRPSDALDASRDLLLDEAAQAIDAEWGIEGSTLTLVHHSLVGNPDVRDSLARL